MRPIANYQYIETRNGYILTQEQIRELQKLIWEQEGVLRAKMRKAILEGAGHGSSDLKTSAKIEPGQPVADPPGDLHKSTLTEDADELLALVAARERLKDNSYGHCIACDGPVSFERLLALPTAQRCITCQEYHEWGTLDHLKTTQ